MREPQQSFSALVRRYRRPFLRMFFGILLAAAAVLTVLFLLPAKREERYPEKITVSYLGRKVSYTREEVVRNGVEYLNFGELCRACGFHISGAQDEVVITTDAGDRLDLRGGDCAAALNGQTCRMESAAYVSGTDIWLPLGFVKTYLSGLEETWNEKRSVLTVARETGSGAVLSFVLKADTPLEKVSSAGVHLRISVDTAELDYDFVTDVSAYRKYMNPEDADAYLLFFSVTTPCASDYVPPDLTSLKNVPKNTSQKLAECAAKSLEAMLAEMAASSGIKNVNAVHAYVPYENQEKNFNNQVYFERYYFKNHPENTDTYFSEKAYAVLGKSYLNSAYISKGIFTLTAADAEKVAAKTVAAPGTSDHQTGFGTDLSYTKSADSSFSGTAAYAWLKENAYKFGFIERYPKEAEKMTGFDYEPYHWRFVGQYHAAVMHRDGYSCLDEYLASLELPR